MPPSLTIPYLPPNLGTLACFIYSGFYLLMEPVAGGMLAAILLAGTAYSNHLTSDHGMTPIYWAAGVHIFSWIAQFIGHGKFEGRAPALMDNLVQAIFLAPLFVWLEVLFFFGYRPELRERVQEGVDKEIAKYRASRGLGANGKPVNGKVSDSAAKH